MWVYDRIDDWKKANGVNTIKWKGNLTRLPGHHEDLSSEFAKVASLSAGEKNEKGFKIRIGDEKIIKIIFCGYLFLNSKNSLF